MAKFRKQTVAFAKQRDGKSKIHRSSRPLTVAIKNNTKQSIHDFVIFLSSPEA